MTIKCPKCGGEGYTYLSEGRYFFACYACGFITYLKMLAIAVKDGRDKMRAKNLGIE